MATVVRKPQARDELRMSVHRGHAITGVVVVYGKSFVRAAGGNVQSTVVQTKLTSTKQCYISKQTKNVAFRNLHTLIRVPSSLRDPLKVLLCFPVDVL